MLNDFCSGGGGGADTAMRKIWLINLFAISRSAVDPICCGCRGKKGLTAELVHDKAETGNLRELLIQPSLERPLIS